MTEYNLMIKKKYIPNLLTSLRILITPIFIYFLLTDYSHGKLIAAFIFFIASLSDAYDGKLARKYGVVTKFGIFFDPLADKLLVLSALVSFVIIGDVKLWMVILISCRDIVITALRSIMQYKGITMITSKTGKLKTMLQVFAISNILLYLIFKSYHLNVLTNIFENYSIINGLMWITTMITVYTGIHYFYRNHKTLRLLFSGE